MARVVLEQLTREYRLRGRSLRAPDGLDLVVEDREFLVIVGPSGCGKSSTLRLLAGLEQPTSGRILFDRTEVTRLPPAARGIAMVFQHYSLFPHLRVFDNIAFGLSLTGLPPDEIHRRVRAAAQSLGLSELLDRKPHSLSGGQRQRVALGRALVRKPRVFLLDEPLSNLDANLRVSLRTEISKLHARLAATMIYVTHDQVEAMTMGDRIGVMNEGRLLQVAEPLELYRHPVNRFVAGFIGSPPMNFLSGFIRAAAGALTFVEDNEEGRRFTVVLNDRLARLAAPYENRPLLLGLRPEHVVDALQLVNPPPGQVVRAAVEVVEPVGPDAFLYLTTGAQSFTARVRPQARYAVNAILPLFIDLDQALLFDPASGNRL